MPGPAEELFHAAFQGDTPAVQRLLAQGVRPDEHRNGVRAALALPPPAALTPACRLW